MSMTVRTGLSTLIYPNVAVLGGPLCREPSRLLWCPRPLPFFLCGCPRGGATQSELGLGRACGGRPAQLWGLPLACAGGQKRLSCSAGAGRVVGASWGVPRRSPQAADPPREIWPAPGLGWWWSRGCRAWASESARVGVARAAVALCRFGGGRRGDLGAPQERDER
ncbi:hypothetical protein NDU88_007142 [Pleurodeles waltl]|uniref:Uncharacterized protein n=1 Tax=Pleurodeles waltl TaxID=8319 RepID=A0AAV7N2X8_PLEWA|nr:hypothetical protein NDU88_007142 [Pleurodeles waltl]